MAMETPEALERKVTSNSTEFGFQFGAALVERSASVGKGAVFVTVTTLKQRFDIYVTKTGKMRLYIAGKELKITKE